MRRCARWSWRVLAAVAVLNLGWDAWLWVDRQTAEGERRFWRGAERADDIDYGHAEIRIVNETDRDYLIDAFVLDGRGEPYTHRPDAARLLARAGASRSVWVEESYLDELLSYGRLSLTARDAGEPRLIDFQVDRRRPVSCRIELRVREDGAEVSDCRPLHRQRPRYFGVFPPLDY